MTLHDHHATPVPCTPPTHGHCSIEPPVRIPDLRGEHVVQLTRRHADAPGTARVRWALYGAANGPLVIVQGGISADRQAGPGSDGTPGWWSALVGPGRAIDTERVRVLSIDWIDRASFSDGNVRAIGSEDQANAIAAVLDTFGMDCVDAFVGASYGAMVGIAFAALHGARLRRLVAIAGAHRAHPLAIAVRNLQRQIVAFGARHGDTRTGLDLARRLAMTTYRGESEFAQRCAAAPVFRDGRYRFAEEEWLQACGARFAEGFDAQRFIDLSESIDLQDVEPAAVRVPSVLVGIASDRLVPLADLCELQRCAGAPATLHVIESIHGHDGFLKEHAQLAPLVRHAIAWQGACA